MSERETLTWSKYGDAVIELAQAVVDSGYEPDVVLSIARGGLIPAGSIAYALDCKALFTMNVEFYTGVGATLASPEILPPFLDVNELDGQRVLVVDDVADSGKTLELVQQFCQGHASEVRTAVLYEKPRSVIKPDFVWKITDLWINFPWSTAPPLVQRSGVIDA